MLPIAPPISPDAFDKLMAMPDYQQRHWELIQGELEEKMVASPKSDRTAMRICARLTVYVIDNQLGEVSGAQGGYWINEDRYIPDGAFINKEKADAPVKEGYVTVAPDLAIEVISPTDADITPKVVNYLLAGTVVWVAKPDEKTVTVYVPMQKPRILHLNDTLTGEPLFPDFALPLTSIFTD